MNKLTIIGNLTRDPELRQTNNGKDVCNFTVAVNRRGKRDQNSNQPEADFFRVTVWNELAKNCANYLAKGKKVCAVGEVSVRTYQANDGTTKAQLEVAANEVEFLTPKSDDGAQSAAPEEQTAAAPAGYTPVNEEDLPF